jgi:hypothetical protein
LRLGVTALVAGLVGMGASCASAPRPRPLGALEARYVLARQQREPRGTTAAPRRWQTATAAYRAVLAPSLGSRCRMFPSDSVLFDARAARCGAATATLLGVSRLLLEAEGSPRFLPALVVEQRLRWLDLPRSGSCAP